MSARKGRRTIKVGALARVEGEGALLLKLKDGAVTDVKLRIYEPPRFFEALLRGRRFDEAPDITARICGICPIAYQMSAIHAMEDAFGVTVGGPLRALRRLIYCGEWIESHVLHVDDAPRPRFPRIRERAPHGSGSRRGRPAGTRAQEGGQRPDDPARRA